MYFPLRLQAWLLSRLPPSGQPHPKLYRFFLLSRNGQHVLECRDGVAEHASVEALDIPDSFSGSTTAECVEALRVLFEGVMSPHTPIGQALGEKVVLETVLGSIEICRAGSWHRPMRRSTDAGQASSS